MWISFGFCLLQQAAQLYCVFSSRKMLTTAPERPSVVTTSDITSIRTVPV